MYRPSKENVYICTSIKIASSSRKYITRFEPVVNTTTTHHITLHGCKNPGREEAIFNCGVMGFKPKKDQQYPSAADVCGSGSGMSQMIYVWSNGASELLLPGDAAIPVSGPDTAVDWLVMQVHYKNVDTILEKGDNTGIIVHYTEIPTPKTVGLLGTNSFGTYPALKTTHNEAACQLSEDIVIHPFRYFVHTHDLGRVVSGWKVNSNMSWTLIGKRDPQSPNEFHSMENTEITMTKGDYLASRCTMVNTKDKLVKSGTTYVDEMCMFYLLYWVDGPKTMDMKFCKSNGYPFHSWSRGFGGKGPILCNIPDEEASTL